MLMVVAKAGYAARGVVYLIIGAFAVLAAVGQGGEATGTKGALLKLLDTGYGTALLVIVAIGLVGYATWRAVQSVGDTDDHGTDAKGLAVRGGLAVSAVTHAALAIWAFSAPFGGGSGSSGGADGQEGLAAWLMQQPFGKWLVLAVGLAVIGAGVAHIVKAARRGYEKWFDVGVERMKLIRPVATLGLVARGVVFLIVGGFFVYAGIYVDPEQAGGLEEALEWMRGLPGGTAIFLVIALGLVAFGLYSLLEACYRRITGQTPASVLEARAKAYAEAAR